MYVVAEYTCLEVSTLRIDLDDVKYITETSLTIRGSRRRTTVPREVTEHLDLSDGSKLRWVIMEDGRVFLDRAGRPDRRD